MKSLTKWIVDQGMREISKRQNLLRAKRAGKMWMTMTAYTC